MEWYFVKPLESVELIDEFEEFVGYKFPVSFRNCVIKNNGGSPEPNVFDTESSEEIGLEHLLSFNKKDDCNIWDMVELYSQNIEILRKNEDYDFLDAYINIAENYIIFADAAFGNLIAFYRADDSVVFIDHETQETEKIADSFDEFINGLYDVEGLDEWFESIEAENNS